MGGREYRVRSGSDSDSGRTVKLGRKRPECTLEVRQAGACIILYMKSWIMRWMSGTGRILYGNSGDDQS